MLPHFAIPSCYQTVWPDTSPFLDVVCKDLQNMGPSEEARPPCEGGQDPQPEADLSLLPPYQGAPDHRHSCHPGSLKDEVMPVQKKTRAGQ
ncbi:hypothetical protein ACFX14_006714 [Malus domestica]